jgi:hypothetical protein
MVEQMTKRTFNSALLNRYNDGSDHMSCHADDEKELGENPYIVSVTLGQYVPLLSFTFHCCMTAVKDLYSKSPRLKYILLLLIIIPQPQRFSNILKEGNKAKREMLHRNEAWLTALYVRRNAKVSHPRENSPTTMRIHS